MAEYLANGSKISISTTSNGTFQELYGLETLPDMGGSPNLVSVTNLSDTRERQIGGIQKMDAPVFGFYYNKETSEDAAGAEKLKNVYSKLTAYQAAGAKLYWKLEYPDNTGFIFEGKPFVSRKGGGVDDPLKFDVTVPMESELTSFNAPASGLTVSSVAGTTTGKTAITVTPAKGDGNSYKYSTGTTVTLPEEYKTMPTTGWTTWDGTAEITATTNNKIAIVEIDSNNKVVKGGIATVISKT